MNIAIFTPSQNPYSETFIQAHKKYLKGKVFYYYGVGNKIQLEGSPRLISKSKHYQLKFKKIIGKKASNYISQQSIIQSLKENKIDVILAEYGPHAHQLLPIIKQAKLPLVTHFHGYDASQYEVLKRYNNYSEMFAYASKVIAVSTVMEKMLLEMGCPREKLIYNVYGPQPEFASVNAIFSKKQFIGIGRFTNKKAPYYTILSFKKVLLKHPDAKLLLAGNGELLNTCENLIKYYKLEENVKLLGVITSEEYRDYLTESIAFVQHSIRASNGDMEGTPLAVLEASATGLPVISTFHAGIPDVIINKKTGLLSQEHDIEAMAENMLLLLGDIELAKRMGKQGKIHIKKNYTLDRHIIELQAVLEEVKLK